MAILFGFHAVGTRLRFAPQSVDAAYVDPSRRDARMRRLRQQLRAAGVRVVEADAGRLAELAGHQRHQGVVASVRELEAVQSLPELLQGLAEPPLLLVLDGVTDPHNLGACLRVADGAGAQAVIAPRDRAAALNATAAKVASGAAETVPYIVVTNLARTLRELKQHGIWVVGTAGEATQDLYAVDLRLPTALVLGAEGRGLRRLTRDTCDLLVRIPMQGAIESLNVSVAAGVCLYEARRQRL